MYHNPEDCDLFILRMIEIFTNENNQVDCDT